MIQVLQSLGLLLVFFCFFLASLRIFADLYGNLQGSVCRDLQGSSGICLTWGSWESLEFFRDLILYKSLGIITEIPPGSPQTSAGDSPEILRA